MLAGLALGALWLIPDSESVVRLLDWFREAGPIGWLGFAAVYVVITVCLLPTSVFTIGGGFLFGPFVGFFVVWISENLGSLACLLIGRYLARPTVEKMVAKRPLLAALDAAAKERGFSLLVLLRHSPLIPFGVLNYAMSLTAMRVQTYVVATLLGTALPAFLYVYVGSTLTKLNDVMQGESGEGGAQSFIYWGGLIATVIATVVVTRATRAALNDRLEQVGIDTEPQ